jgi:hypothetical protein
MSVAKCDTCGHWVDESDYVWDFDVCVPCWDEDVSGFDDDIDNMDMADINSYDFELLGGETYEQTR